MRIKHLLTICLALATLGSAIAQSEPSKRRIRILQERGFVLYSDLGARGDGRSDDMAAIVATHAFANTHGLRVQADAGASYYISGKDLTAVIRTDTDFGTARFIIDDTEVENNRSPVFLVDSELETFSLEGISTLKRGQEKIDVSLPASCLVTVRNTKVKHYIRMGLNQNKGSAQKDIFIVDREGNVDMDAPIIWDFNEITEISARPIDDQLLTIKGGKFTTIANGEESRYNYYSRGFAIRRSNVLIQDLEHLITGEGEQGAPYGGFLNIGSCAYVEVRNTLLTGHKTYKTIGSAGKPVQMGSYDISMNSALNVSFISCSQSNDIDDKTYWGIMGSNYCKNLLLDSCTFSRFDAHQGVANATIRNSTLGHMGINAIGSGIFTVEGCSIRAYALMNLRTDYGSTWEGEFHIRNCTFVPNAGRPSSASLINGHNSGMHDFGYTCFMPERIIIENLHIDDSAHPEGYQGPAIFADFNPNRTDGPFVEHYPYVLTKEVVLRNVTTASGKELQLSKNPHMFRQVTLNRDKMDWWKDAKFGMFIHWGVYSVPAGVYKGEEIPFIGEWIMNRAEIPVEEYHAYAAEFNPVKYDPEAWVKLAKEAGMKYIVITSKHHDGFALFDSKVSSWDIADATPYGKDLLEPLVAACRRHGLRIGFYYSQAQDWMHPGGGMYRERWDPLQEGSFDTYLDEIAVPQVKEILSGYGDIDILWWDTPAQMNEERARKFLPVIENYPELITNPRLGGGFQGDLQTPEQFVPPAGLPGVNWETCMTMNNTWGYKRSDHNWKSTESLILKLIHILSKGGNFLLNVGPTDQGLIPEASIERLQQIGQWTRLHQEAIYGTEASPFHFLPWGSATRKEGKVYLFVEQWPGNGQLKVPLLNEAGKAYLLTDPRRTYPVQKLDNGCEIGLSGQAPDSIATVIVLEIEGEPEVLPIPSEGKAIKASSEKPGHEASRLLDNSHRSRWVPEQGDELAWVEIDLGEPTAIQAFAVIEPWHVWDHKGQKLELQYKAGNSWLTACTAETKGVGHLQDFDPVTARYFRLRILESKDPALNQWILFRAD